MAKRPWLWLCCCLLLMTQVHTECFNACSGHGKCTSYDMCICNRNWQANDCSERVCLYGLAHVDTPKGDLDMSGGISGPEHVVAENSATFPYGTTEQFPQMEDTDMHVLTQSAHYYMECSNKGICNRRTGECDCFDGYDGVACQRASCPGWPLDTCSGHGRCLTAAQMARADYGNSYTLWDKDSTMGCKCDPGYHGAACDQRACKAGIDPLYLDDSATIKFSTFDLATLTTAPGFSDLFDRPSFFTAEGVLFNDGTPQGRPGFWAIRFFDATGEDWVTNPVRAGASCNEVVKALEALPNSVVPKGATQCTRSYNAAATSDRAWTTTGGRSLLAACTTSLSYSDKASFTATTSNAPSYALSITAVTEGTPVNGMVVSSAHMSTSAGEKVTVSRCSKIATFTAYTADQTTGSSTLIITGTTAGTLTNDMAITVGLTTPTLLRSCSLNMTGFGTCTMDDPQVVVPGPLTTDAYQYTVCTTSSLQTIPNGEVVTGLLPGASLTLNIAATTQGALKTGAHLRGQGIPPGTFVVDASGLSGGAGTVTLSNYVNVGTEVVVAYSSDRGVEMVGSLMSGSAVAVVASISTGVLALGMSVTGLGVADGTTLSGYAPAVPQTTLAITADSVNVALLQVSSVADLYVGQAISGAGIPAGVQIESIVDNSLRLTNLVTVSAGASGVVSAAIPAGSSAGATGVYLLSQVARSSTFMLPLEAFSVTAPPPIYDAAHPATSKHPYKITYRMSVWDAYAALNSEDVGEGGAETPLVWAPGSFPNTDAATQASGGAFNTPLVARTHTSGSGNSMVVEPPGARRYFTAAAAGGQGDATITLTSVAGLVVYYSYLFGSAAFPPGGARVISVDATGLVVGIDPPLLGGLSGGAALFSQSQKNTMMDSLPRPVAATTGARTLQFSPTAAKLLPVGDGLRDSGDVRFYAELSSASATLTVLKTWSGALVNGMMVSGCGIVGKAVVSGCTLSATIVGGTGGVQASTLTISSGTATNGQMLTPVVSSTGGAVFLSACTASSCDLTDILGIAVMATVAAGTSLTATGAGTCTLDSTQSIVTGAACIGSPAVFFGTTNGPGTLLAITSVTSGTPMDTMPVSGGGGITATGVTLSDCKPATQVTASAAGTVLTITALVGATPLAPGMLLTGAGITGTVTLTTCNGGATQCTMSESLTFPSTTVSGSQVCTLSSSHTVSLASPLYGADAQWAPGSAIAPGTIILRTDGNSGAVTLSKPLLAPLPAFKQLVISPYASLAPDMLFTTPLASTPAVPSKITAVSGPDLLGLYTLTFSGPARTFTAGDSVHVLQGGQSLTAASYHATLSGYIYRLRLLGNPGRLRQPEIVTHLDGRRNSLMSVNYFAGDYDPTTLAAGESHYKVITKVWTDGQQGESVDQIADHCDGVQVRIGNYGVSLDGKTVSETTVQLDGSGSSGNVNAAARFFLTGLTTDKKARLKRCLGASDFDDTNNVGVYNWDFGGADAATGAITFPHLIKLVRSVTAYTDGGYYAALYYSEVENMDDAYMDGGGTFFLLNPFSPPDSLATDWYDVYTTKGTLALTSSAATAVFGFASKTIYTVTNAGVAPLADEVKSAYNIPSTGSAPSSFNSSYDGDVSCVRTLGNGGKFAHLSVAQVRTLDTASTLTVCLSKSDLVTFLNPGYGSSAMNPPHLNLYTVTRLEKRLPQWSNWQRYGSQLTPGYNGKALQFMTNEVHLDLATNWGSSVGSPMGSTSWGSRLGGQEGIDSMFNSSAASGFALYKFFPHVDSSYEYVAPCSNRGSCNVDRGLCECFAGYTSDDCHQQTTLAL